MVAKYSNCHNDTNTSKHVETPAVYTQCNVQIMIIVLYSSQGIMPPDIATSTILENKQFTGHIHI